MGYSSFYSSPWSILNYSMVFWPFSLCFQRIYCRWDARPLWFNTLHTGIKTGASTSSIDALVGLKKKKKTLHVWLERGLTRRRRSYSFSFRDNLHFHKKIPTNDEQPWCQTLFTLSLWLLITSCFHSLCSAWCHRCLRISSGLAPSSAVAAATMVAPPPAPSAASSSSPAPRSARKTIWSESTLWWSLITDPPGITVGRRWSLPTTCAWRRINPVKPDSSGIECRVISGKPDVGFWAFWWTVAWIFPTLCNSMIGGTISLNIPKLKIMEEGLVSPHWLVITRITPSFPFIEEIVHQTLDYLMWINVSI